MIEERKRQKRGMDRMESLLAAAALEFAEQGYERCTTNQIAARAGVSPGTLYQFFPHKQAMAQALASRYAVAFEAVHANVFSEGMEKLPLPQWIDLIVDPFLEFHRAAPAFEALLLAGALGERTVSLKHAFAKRLAGLFLLRCPGAKRLEMQNAAEVAMAIFSGMLPMLIQGGPAARRRATVELKLVLERYLAPILDNGAGVR